MPKATMRQRHTKPTRVPRPTSADDIVQSFARAVAERIVPMPIAELKPFDRRTRTHGEDQLARIMGSFAAFGVLTPIVLDEAGRILAGHARVEAARRLGYASLPAVVASHLTAEEKRAYVIADNRLAELAGWDREVLAIELKDLATIDLGFDLDVIGFSTAEIDIIVADSETVGSADDALPALRPDALAVTRPGDLWQLGRHRLICASALDECSYPALLAGRTARMVLTDPPYNVPIDGFVGGSGAVKHREFAMASGEMSQAQFTEFLTRALAWMAAHTVDGGLLYAFMDWRHEYELLTAAKAVGLGDHNLCIWNKLSGGMGSHYRSQHELCRIFKVGTAPHLNTVELGRHGRNRSNVWDHPGLSSFGRGREEALASHPTVKPVALLVEAIKDATRRGDLVLDPFLGSGSTLIAAERCGRRAAGIEIDPLYCDTIIRRFEALTGESAIHTASGLTFAALAERRAQSDGEAATDETKTDAAPGAAESRAPDASGEGHEAPGPAAAPGRARPRERSRSVPGRGAVPAIAPIPSSPPALVDVLAPAARADRPAVPNIQPRIRQRTRAR